jgi:uncharacterized protein DUF1573
MEKPPHDPSRACDHVTMCPFAHGEAAKSAGTHVPGHMGTWAHGHMVLLACALAFSACRLTDHTEGHNDEVSAAEINVPASGYETIDTTRLPRFAFDTASFDFGRITQGTSVEHSYRFTNAGGSDLLITDVRASCGCTVAKDWPKHPVKPGESAAITVTFNSEGRSGLIEKVVTVVANTKQASTPLFLRGEVVAPPGAPVSE